MEVEEVVMEEARTRYVGGGGNGGLCGCASRGGTRGYNRGIQIECRFL